MSDILVTLIDDLCRKKHHVSHVDQSGSRVDGHGYARSSPGIEYLALIVIVSKPVNAPR
jgi:hypothetical protein